MNGIEGRGHNMARHTADPKVKRQLAMAGRHGADTDLNASVTSLP